MKDVMVTVSPRFGPKFQRCVRDDKGQPIETMVFVRGEIVRVPAELFDAIKKDVGNALVICKEKSGVVKADEEATKQFVEYLSTQAAPKTPAPAKAPAKRKSRKKPVEEPKVADEPEQADGEPDEQPVPEQE